MPTLLDGFSHRLAFILKDYVETPTRLQEFIQNPFKRMLAYLFFNKQVTTELALNEAKHTIAGNFSVLYLPQIGEQTIKLRAAEHRNTPTLNALDFAPVLLTVPEGREDALITLIDARLLDTNETRKRNLDVLARELTEKLILLEERRAGHKEGQLEGILAANLAAVNVIINFYNQVAIHLIEDFDAIDHNSDYYARLMRFTAEYLRDFAYDRSLSRYSEQHKIKISSEHYLGSGAEKLPPHIQDYKLRVLYNALVYSTLAYSQVRVLLLVKESPDVVLGGKHARILTHAFNGITDGTDITNHIPRYLPTLYTSLSAYDMLKRKEIGNVPFKNSSYSERLYSFDHEYPRLPAAAKCEEAAAVDADQYIEDTVASVVAARDNEVEPCESMVNTPRAEVIPLILHHSDPEKRLMEYAVNVSECGSEDGPEEIERAKSAFTPQLTPLWQDLKTKYTIFTPPCGVLYGKNKGHGKASPAPVVPTNRMVVG